MNENLLKLLNGFTLRYPHALEQKYSRVLNKIIELWGTPALEGYFNELMLDTRPTRRQGFPRDVASDIFALSNAHTSWHQATAGATTTLPKVENVWEHLPANKRHEFEIKGLEFSPEGFEKAVEANNEEAVNLYLSCGVDVDTSDERNWTPLTLASFNGNAHLAMLLIQYGANVGAKDKNGYTPLHWAVFQGQDSVADLLIAKGADVNAASQFGWTPLMQAATRGHLIAVAKLLAKGARPNDASVDGWTALHKAAANGHGDVVRLLLSKGADPSISHPNGSTALTLARRYRHDGIAEMLMSYGAHAAAPVVTAMPAAPAAG